MPAFGRVVCRRRASGVALLGGEPYAQATAVRVVQGDMLRKMVAKDLSRRCVSRVLHDARWLVEQAVRLVTRPLGREPL